MACYYKPGNKTKSVVPLRKKGTQCSYNIRTYPLLSLKNYVQ